MAHFGSTSAGASEPDLMKTKALWTEEPLVADSKVKRI
jgi:hypothetical protein